MSDLKQLIMALYGMAICPMEDDEYEEAAKDERWFGHWSEQAASIYAICRPPTGDLPTTQQMVQIMLELEKVYQPHRAELREAMVEWTKHRTPRELIELIRSGMTRTTSAQGSPARSAPEASSPEGSQS
jgi:hypothetical protein